MAVSQLALTGACVLMSPFFLGNSHRIARRLRRQSPGQLPSFSSSHFNSSAAAPVPTVSVLVPSSYSPVAWLTWETETQSGLT
jgi:hypothetical protein